MTALLMERVRKARGTGAQRVQALRGATLEVTAGEFVLLEGPSGSGKTTLLALAGGLLIADDGRVLLGGTDLAGLRPVERRRVRARRVGFVFQGANLLTGLSVFENVQLAALLAGVSAAEASRSADGLLAALGIPDLASRSPASLSGGQEMRAAVARALVHGPSLVLADEPSASLDGAAALAVAEALARLASERGTAVLVATHDTRLHPFASRRVGLVDGWTRETPAHG